MTMLFAAAGSAPMIPAYARSYFSSVGSGGAVVVFGVAVLAAAAFWGTLYYWGRFRPQTDPSGRAGLFDDLALAHHLTKEDQALLRRAAAGAPSASLVFVDSGLLDRLAEASPGEAGECVRLRERLFGA
jgi:hypothetical protein